MGYDEDRAAAKEKRLRGAGWRLAELDYFRHPHEAFSAVVFGMLTLFAIWLIYVFASAIWTLIAGLSDPKAASENAKNLLLTVGASVAAPFVVWRSWIAHQQWRVGVDQAKTQTETMQTGLLTKAIEQLGAMREEKVAFRGAPEMGSDGNQIEGKWDVRIETVPNIEVRLGAIYLLKRLAEDNDRDHGPILETLCAYVRENSRQEWRKWSQEEAKRRGLTVDPTRDIPSRLLMEATDIFGLKNGDLLRIEKTELKFPKTREDIQSAIRVIGDKALSNTRKNRNISASLSLHESLLIGTNFAELCWDSVNFFGADLTFANFNLSHCDRTRFDKATCDGAKFYKSLLTNCNFDKSMACGAYFQESEIRKCQINNCCLRGASILSTSLHDTNLISSNLESSTIDNSSFERCNLMGSTLNYAKTNRTKFNYSELKSLSLFQGKFSQTAINDSQLNYSFLDDADLATVSNLDQETLRTCFGNNKTVLPQSIDRSSLGSLWKYLGEPSFGYSTESANRYSSFQNVRGTNLFLAQHADINIPT